MRARTLRICSLTVALAVTACADPPPERSPLVLPVAAPASRTAPPVLDPSTSGAPSAVAPPSATPSDAPRTIDDWVAAQKATHARLDRTLWQPEEAAQRHEQVIVELWDAIRAEGAYIAMRRVPIRRLTIPAWGEAVTRAPEVEVRPQAGAGPTLDAGAWLRQLDAWEKDGLQIEQTEWHHARFEPASRPGASPVSRVKFEVHARHQGARLALRGTAVIRWQKRQPRHVAIEDATLWRRAGRAVFEELQRIPMGPNRPQAVIAHDLDGDARPEILLPWSNQRYVSAGGPYVAAPLADGLLPGAEGASLADFTGDGIVDLLVSGRAGGRVVVALHSGDAQGNFGPPRVVFNPEPPLERVRLLVPGDVDGDGDLDVWVAQYRGAYNGGRMPQPFHDANDSWPGYLLRNDAGAFTDVTAAAGLADTRRRHTQGATFFDMDADGDADLLTVNDFAGVDLHHNAGGRFSRATDALGDARHLFGMAHAIADLNGDGHLDIFATGMNSTTARRLEALGLNRPDRPAHPKWRAAMTFGNRLLLGGPQGFTQAPYADQVAASGWSWGTVAFDLENDGDVDLYVLNGFVSGRTAQDYCTQYWRHDVHLGDEMPAAAANAFLGERIQAVESGISWNGFEHDRLFINRGANARGPRFIEAAHLFGLAGEPDGRNLIATDLDGDGRTDLLLAEAPPGKGLRLRVLRNIVKDAGHWLGVRVGGQAIGAHVEVETARGRRVALIAAGDSFLSQAPPSTVFGLGQRNQVERVTVRWPDGRSARLDRPATDRWHQVAPPSP